MMQKPHRKNPYLLLAGATLLFYLPVASLRFAIKNDLFTGYFPARFHLSAFLHEGLFPLWDPWLNYGLPLYGDITSTAWNPLTVLIASTTGYNAYTMTAEVLLALFTAGATMHALCLRLGFEARSSLITALAYMACGYFIGDLQHLNWVWGAALLPWCAIGFLQFTGSGRWRNIPSAALPFFLFLTAAHPGLMIGALYLFLFWAIALSLGIGPDMQGRPDGSPIRRALLLFAAVVVASLGLAYGYGHNLQLTTRAPGAGWIGPAHGAYTLNSWISVFLPFSTVSSGPSGDKLFGTDIAIRNAYIGILPLVLVLYALIFQRTKWTLYWAFVIAFFLIVSAEPNINGGLDRYLPLLGQVRLPGEFRIFAMFGGLILSASVLHGRFRDTVGRSDRIAFMLRALAVLFIVAAAIALVSMLITKQGILFQTPIEPGMKGWLHGLTLTDTMLIQSVLQTLLCFGLYRCFKSDPFPVRKIILLVALDMTLAGWLNLPFTGVGSRSVSEIQSLIDHSPKGIPALDPGITMDITDSYPMTDSVIGNWGLYSKQIAYRRPAAYPMKLTTGARFFPDHSDSLLNKRLLFADDEHQPDLSVVAFHPDLVKFEVRTDTEQILTWKQMYHPGWKAVINGRPVEKQLRHGGLIAVQVPAGASSIDFIFSDPMARWAQAYHLSAFVMLLVITLYHRVRRR